jgi:hypothetical protein
MKMTNQQIHSLAIAEAIVQRRAFTLLAYSDGTPTQRKN